MQSSRPLPWSSYSVISWHVKSAKIQKFNENNKKKNVKEKPNQVLPIKYYALKQKILFSTTDIGGVIYRSQMIASLSSRNAN